MDTPKHTDVNGDPRYDYTDADGYTLRSTLEPLRGEIPLYGVIDSEGGYIAFTTSEKYAQEIVAALDAM